MPSCAVCGTALELSPRGRPPKYCGVSCRRAAEYELRRLQRALENQEEIERSYRQDMEGAAQFPRMGTRSRLKDIHAWHVAEIGRLQARVRELCE